MTMGSFCLMARVRLARTLGVGAGKALVHGQRRAVSTVLKPWASRRWRASATVSGSRTAEDGEIR